MLEQKISQLSQAQKDRLFLESDQLDRTGVVPEKALLRTLTKEAYGGRDTTLNMLNVSRIVYRLIAKESYSQSVLILCMAVFPMASWDTGYNDLGPFWTASIGENISFTISLNSEQYWWVRLTVGTTTQGILVDRSPKEALSSFDDWLRSASTPIVNGAYQKGFNLPFLDEVQNNHLSEAYFSKISLGG